MQNLYVLVGGDWWVNLTGAKKVHSLMLIDKVYKRKNLEMAWEKVMSNRGSEGVDGQSLEAFQGQLSQQLDRLHRELRGYHKIQFTITDDCSTLGL